MKRHMSMTGNPLAHTGWYQAMRSWFALSLMITSLLVHIPWLRLMELGYPAEERGFLWLRVGQRIARLYFSLAGIKIKIIGSLQDISSPVIYAGNHLTLLDGFVLNILFGPRLVSLTAPFSSFPPLFSYWFRKSASIEISRDEYDASHFKGGEDRKEALGRLIRKLTEGISVVIFPEGHYEKTEQLHYVHTGVARVAIRAQKPVQLFTITSPQKLFLDHYKVRPGVMTVSIGPLLYPPRVSRHLPFRKATLEFRKEILDGLKAMLPRDYLPDYLFDARQEFIAAFFDLDRTIYEHFSQRDFFRFLIKHRHMSLASIAWFFSLSLQRGIGILDDCALARRVYTFFSGWSTGDVRRATEAFFHEVVPEQLVKDILPYVKDHQEAAHQLVLVTAVPHPLSRLFANYFQMRCLDTQLEIMNGCYTGRVLCLMNGKEKVSALKKYALQHHVDLDRSYAFADSWSDYGMLHCVRHPYAVNPDTRLLVKAQELNWKVLKK